MTNLEQLARYIGEAYRHYDEYPDRDKDFEVYFDDRRKCYMMMANEYADALSLGTVIDPEVRAKSLLRGMLKFVSTLYPVESYCDKVVDIHWEYERVKPDVHGRDKSCKFKDVWIDVDLQVINKLGE